MWSDLADPGPATPPARPPEQCTCDRMTVPDMPDLAGTLGCPGKWRELPDGQWRHTWPRRRRRTTATEVTTRGNRP